MKEIRLLVVGIPGKERWSVWDDTFYTYASPYADREGVLAYRVHRNDPDAMIGDFHAYRDPMDKERMMKVFHFVLFARPEEQMEQTLKSGALSVLEWFKLRGHQVLMVPHDGGANCNVGRHWHMSSLKTGQFKAELDEVINALRFDRKYGGMLKDRRSLAEFCSVRPEGAFNADRYDYGYRADTEKYAYMFRLNPNPGLYNVYCYCYVREWLDGHMGRAKRGIRFITPDYRALFRIPDGGKIRFQLPDGRHVDEVCRYIDETHMEVGRRLYHICEFAELMERAGVTVKPLECGEEVNADV